MPAESFRAAAAVGAEGGGIAYSCVLFWVCVLRWASVVAEEAAAVESADCDSIRFVVLCLWTCVCGSLLGRVSLRTHDGQRVDDSLIIIVVGGSAAVAKA